MTVELYDGIRTAVGAVLKAGVGLWLLKLMFDLNGRVEKLDALWQEALHRLERIEAALKPQGGQ